MTIETPATDTTIETPATDTTIETPPVETATQPQNDENTTTNSDETPVETPEVKAPPTQAEYNALYFQLKQKEREMEASQSTPSQEPTPSSDTSDAPTLEDHDFDNEAFMQASIQHQVNQQVASALDKQKVNSEKAAQATQAQEIEDTFNGRAVEYASTNPDYEKAIEASNGMQFASHIQEALLSSEVGPQLDYMLLSDPALATKLNNMTPTQALMHMGKMESTIGSKTTKSAAKVISNAPAPIVQTGGATRTQPDYRYDDSLSFDEYEAKMMADRNKS
jgi:hypothetical protein